MSSELENFRAWYVGVLDTLYPNREGGIAVFMISLPLAERYLRQKNQLGPEMMLNDAFMDSFRAVFPVLQDVQAARSFWNVYRNGFLHQATLSMHTRGGAALPGGWLTHDMADPIQIRNDGSFCVHPVLFSKRIVSEIEADFAVFAGVTAGAPPLPVVTRLDPVTIPSSYLGTRTPP